jgi:hypothetical protein
MKSEQMTVSQYATRFFPIAWNCMLKLLPLSKWFVCADGSQRIVAPATTAQKSRKFRHCNAQQLAFRLRQSVASASASEVPQDFFWRKVAYDCPLKMSCWCILRTSLPYAMKRCLCARSQQLIPSYSQLPQQTDSTTKPQFYFAAGGQVLGDFRHEI